VLSFEVNKDVYYCLWNSDLNDNHHTIPLEQQHQQQQQEHNGPANGKGSTPEVLYAHIVPVPGEDGHDNVTSPNTQNENGGVIYSELQNAVPQNRNASSSDVHANI